MVQLKLKYIVLVIPVSSAEQASPLKGKVKK
jgi:hypothetical protein